AVSALTLTGLRKNWAYTIPSLTGMTRQLALTGIWLFDGLSALIVVSFLTSLPDNGLKLWLAYWFASGWAMLALSRIGLSYWLKQQARSGTLARRTVIAGGGEAAATLISQLSVSGNTDIKILGLFDDRGIDRSPDNVGGYAKLGNFAELAEFCRAEKIDLIIVALPPAAEDRILHLLKKLWVLPIDIRVSAHGSRLKLRERAYSRIGNVPFLPIFDKPMSDWGHAMKTIEDRVIAALALIALSPVFAVVAMAIKYNSRGPVFFRQIRYGFNNEPIHVLKFRSMYTDQCDTRATKLVTKDDPRVTAIGRFIRKTSIDELPQLINVLRGDLSLVGPRPHAMQAKAANQVYDEAVDGYFARHKMKPGITGWAQINGWRGETDTLEKIEQRVAHDLHYIENWSLFLDLYILIKTPLSLLDTKNA
ncbi:MAG: undecaprenyl-phosphate glucose phosphotransferase, partial [Beijerinckiaceae bacterium]|nr:undecaprenyl-phosphate glucose phosphotransferase [Beijerinckiaceae bacterium]